MEYLEIYNRTTLAWEKWSLENDECLTDEQAVNDCYPVEYAD